MKPIILSLVLAAWCCGQTTINGSRTVKGALVVSGASSSMDASGAGETAPVKTGTSLPATCNSGDLYFKTDDLPGANLYACTTVNTWQRQSWAQGTAAARPAACTLGQLYFVTDATAGQNLQGCTTTGNPGTWSALGGGGVSTGGSHILDYQALSNPVLTGTSGTDIPVYSYTIPANTLGPSRCIRVTFGWSNNSGNSAVNYNLKFGGTVVNLLNSSTGNPWRVAYYICGNPTVTNSQNIFPLVGTGGSGNAFEKATATEDVTQSIVVRLTVSATVNNYIYPTPALAELLQ